MKDNENLARKRILADLMGKAPRKKREEEGEEIEPNLDMMPEDMVAYEEPEMMDMEEESIEPPVPTTGINAKGKIRKPKFV